MKKELIKFLKALGLVVLGLIVIAVCAAAWNYCPENAVKWAAGVLLVAGLTAVVLTFKKVVNDTPNPPALVVPGDLIVEPGGKLVVHNGDVAINPNINKKGCDLVVKAGVEMHIDGNVLTGGEQAGEIIIK